MANEPAEPERNGEVVPFRPAGDAEAGHEPAEVLPAVPGVPGDGAAPVIYDKRRVPGERLPVIPPNWRSRQEIRSSLALIGSQQWHRARFHGVRLPLHILVVLWCALTGLLRLAAVHLHWWWVLESHGLRSQAVVDGDERAWMRLHKTMDRILTPEELAEHLGLSPHTLHHWRQYGKGPKWFRAGKHVRYRESAVAQWVKEQEELAADHL